MYLTGAHSASPLATNEEKCRPRVDEVNFCGIFTGTLDVYGKNQKVEEASNQILSYVNDVLNHPEPSDLHPELSSLSSIDNFDTNQSFDSTDDTAKQLHGTAKQDNARHGSCMTRQLKARHRNTRHDRV